ncbi:Conserved_hypothetical protein [Hexamita inflata]|uniref:N-acetyltransferase domain-containing protein n=1 Tax=Hexamita inflata TaxID=28002 RepID=A0AA86UVF2_9EUKA|nr:Conserved hypothetical protein [Hexamita inflata]
MEQAITSPNAQLSEEIATKIREILMQSNFEMSEEQIAEMLGTSKSAVYKQKKLIILQHPQMKLEFAAMLAECQTYPNKTQCNYISQVISELPAKYIGYQATRNLMIKFKSILLSLQDNVQIQDSDIWRLLQITATYYDCLIPIPTQAQFYNYFALHGLLGNKRTQILLSDQQENNFVNIFINQQNCKRYFEGVLTYLESDYYTKLKIRIEQKQFQKISHFWFNRTIINDAFIGGSAIVSVNDKNEIVGYMTWEVCDQRLEIDVAEVKEEYRGRGILKNMIQALLVKYVDIAVLTGNILPQSQLVFERLGWEKIIQDSNHYFKTIKPKDQNSIHFNELPDGLSIAIFSKFDLLDQKEYLDYSTIKKNVNNFKMKYFKIDLDESGRLNLPIVTKFDQDGYIGIFFNKQLIKDGKAKQLFKNATYKNLLILDKQNFVLKEEWNIK